MVQYTVDKDGKVISKGKDKKPLPTRYMEGVKSAGKKIIKGLKKSPFLKKVKPKPIKPKPKPPKPIKPKPKPKRKK
jgi:hypothetical protein